MKYFSEITNKTYNTVEDLQAAEQKVKEQFEKKQAAEPATTPKKAVDTARKEAADKVDNALVKLSEVRASNTTKKQELVEKLDEIEAKYNKQYRELETKKLAEEEELHKEIKALDKAVAQEADAVRKELAEFCKKYGPYHYSVDAKNADLFPLLWSIREGERFKDLFGAFFGSHWPF